MKTNAILGHQKTRLLARVTIQWILGPMLGLIMTVGISTMMGWVY